MIVQPCELTDGSILSFVEKDDGLFRVDAFNPARGKTFEGVAWVYDWGQNATLLIERGLRMLAVQAIVNRVLED
jgi:hypothetical protein